MSTWLKLLPQELSEIKDFCNPREPVQSNETIIGKATEDIKKLFTLTEKLSETAARYALEVRYSKDERVQQEANAKAQELKYKEEIIRKIMWACINDELNLWGKNFGIGIREDFIIVELSNNEPFNFLNLLRGL